MPHAGGRPTELTPEVIEDVRRLLPTVLYLESVADYIGVARQNVRRWIKRGALEEKRLRKNKRAKPRKSEAIYLEFRTIVKKAIAEGELYDAGVIKKAAADTWTAAAWRLERRFPERWAKRENLDLTHRGSVGVEVTEIIVRNRKEAQDALSDLPEAGGVPGQ